jgi:deazaflavin-dependent oxidoreductase (nitroreductase family)
MSISDTDIITEFRANGGKVGGFYEGTPLLLLTTIGRKSGKRHTTPLAYEFHGDKIILVAANIGSHKHPDWYYNLLAHPQVEIEVGNQKRIAWANILQGEAREKILTRGREAWAEARAQLPELPPMPTEVERQIPVVSLTLLS